MSHLILLALLCLVLPIILASTLELPENIAIHFNLYGQATGNYATSYEFKVLFLSSVIGINFIIFLAFYSVRFLPVSAVNLPNREYWLAPERKNQTMMNLYESGLWMTVALNLWLSLIYMLLADANAQSPPCLDNFITIVGMVFFMGALLYITKRFYQMHKVVPEQNTAD
ncbi:MAG: hypothetical protein SGI98_01850 [Verrucomicrobiota bacterium]|nr:hypothetical protein [Verrucomicrobiota bacterium]